MIIAGIQLLCPIGFSGGLGGRVAQNCSISSCVRNTNRSKSLPWQAEHTIRRSFPERRLDTQTAICIEAILHQDRCVDEIAVELGLSFFYARPRCSELVTLGLLKKGGLKISPTHGRSAHVVEPAPDLVHALMRNPIDDLDELRALIRSMIVARVAETSRVSQQNRGPHA